jgi:hypothetical protein
MKKSVVHIFKEGGSICFSPCGFHMLSTLAMNKCSSCGRLTLVSLIVMVLLEIVCTYSTILFSPPYVRICFNDCIVTILEA